MASVHFSSLPSSPSPPPPPASRLTALKSQIRQRNAGLLSSTRHTLTRRRSLLTLHQQQMELISADALDPFSNEPIATADAANSNTAASGSGVGDKVAQQQVRVHGRGHSRNASMAVRGAGGEAPLGVGSLNVAELAAMMASKLQPTEEKEKLKLSRRDMRLLRQQITSQHPALYSDTGVEERDDPPPRIETITATRFTSRLTSPSATAASFSALTSMSKPTTASSTSSSSFLSSHDASLTPRIAFSQKRVDKFDESVKVIMAFGHDEMEHIRTEILKRGGGVTRSQFLAIAVKQSRPPATAPQGAYDAYYREVEALAEMFEEIDVNGDGDLQYSEFTSYLVELANGRYDHHHIDQLLHTDYRVLEPVGNDDRIDVVSVVWYGQLGHFVLFEKGQHRFKVLDGQKRVVKVVRGHMGEMIDSEWLPLHGVLVTSSSDRTLKFWSVEEKSAHDDSRVKRRSGPTVSASNFTPIPRASSTSSSSSSAFPIFHCLATWSLPSPQVSLCWCHGRLYSADILGRLLVWNVDVGEIRHSTHAHDGRVTALCSGEDGWLVSGGMDGWVRVWEGGELRLLGEWRHDGGVRTVCWDSERRLVLSGGDDDCVRVWSSEHRRLLRTVNFRTDTDLTNKPHHPKQHSTAPNTARPPLHSTPSTSTALASSTAASSSPSTTFAAEMAASGDSILGLCVCGPEVLVMSQYGVLRVLDASRWRVEQTLVVPRVWDDKGRDEEEESESDDDEEADDGADKQLSLRARDLITSFTVIRAAACSPPPPSTSSLYTYSHTPPPPAENIIIASAGSRLYAFTRNTAVNHHVADSHAVLAALYNPITFSILTAAHRSLKVWDACTGRLLKEFHDIVPRGSVVSCVVLDGRGRKVVVGGTDGRVSVFNCQTGAEMQQLDRHDGEVACLSYVEEIERGDNDDAAAVTQAGGGGTAASHSDVSKILCGCRSGVYIHHDDHEAALNNSSYTSLYHSSFDHRTDVTALVSSAHFHLIASASSDTTIVFYPANLDGTPLQKLHVPSAVSALLFLHPYRLLLAACSGGAVHVYCFSNEQHMHIGEWRNTNEATGDGATVTCVAMDAATDTLYTGDESGCVKGWPLGSVLFTRFRALLSSQQLSVQSMQLPDPAALRQYFPLGALNAGMSVGLCVRAHTAAVTSVSVIAGREGRWSAEARAQQEEREAEVLREEDEWKERGKEAYESAVYRTAQLLYEGATRQHNSSSAGEDGVATSRLQSPTSRVSSAQPTAFSPRSTLASASSPTADGNKPLSSSLSMLELLAVLSPSQLAQLNKEKKRIARQLQSDYDVHFHTLRSANRSQYDATLHTLDLQYGSPTALLSASTDGTARLSSTEDGCCLGELHQGEVATLGKGTPSQWRYYVNMEERKRRDRARLDECIREMEEEREQWALDEQQRAADEAARQQMREEEQALKEEDDDDPNDMLPFKRAATLEQKKIMDAVEQQTTADINTVAFQTKIGRKHNKAAEAAAAAQSAAPALSASNSSFPPLSSPTSASRSAVPFASQSAFTQAGALSPVALPALQPAQPKHRSTASLTFEAEYKRADGRQQRSRARRPSDTEDSKQQTEPPSLQLSKLQELRVAVAKAIPLYGRAEGEGAEEEKEQILHAPTLVKVAKAAALQAAARRINAGKDESIDRRQVVQRAVKHNTSQ